MVLAGQGGSDIISIEGFRRLTDNDTITIFGDWGYGAEGNRYSGPQYGDSGLEKKLWGDADIIDIDDGEGKYTINVYAGDGDDYIETEYGAYLQNIYGGRDNDTIRWGGGDF